LNENHETSPNKVATPKTKKVNPWTTKQTLGNDLKNVIK
jgi:hypothetical protein